MLPADVFAFARHAAFETAPHPFERLFSKGEDKGEENETRPKRFGASFASEAPLSARLAALADAEKRLAALAAEVSSSKRENASALLESTRASLARLSLVAAARDARPALGDDALAALEAAAVSSETETDSPASFDAFFSSATNGAARRFAALGASAHAMFGFEESTRDAREPRGWFFDVVPALVTAARDATEALAAAAGDGTRAVDAGAFSDAARRVRLAARGVSASARGDGFFESDAADAARAAVFEAIRAFATSSRTPPSARATALEILSENCSANTRRRGDSNGGENAREKTRGVERRARPSDAADADADDGQDRETQIIDGSVSYTHLTLPTKA